MQSDKEIINSFTEFITQGPFPCIGAKAAVAKNQLHCRVFGNMSDTDQDQDILSYLYDSIVAYHSCNDIFFSIVVIFKDTENITEDSFETLLWQKLQSLSDKDAALYKYDHRVSADTDSVAYSFSLMEEAFFIIGLHPASSRPARRFGYPALVFNPHAQFEVLKSVDKYESIKNSVRRRDLLFAGSHNPMLGDHGEASEVVQYSGKNYQVPLQCPLHSLHAK